jgi:hypothetical protein
LEVVATVMVVRAVELAPGEGLFYPVEESFMAYVHPQCDLWLASVPTEMPFTEQQAHQDPSFEVSRQ